MKGKKNIICIAALVVFFLFLKSTSTLEKSYFKKSIHSELNEHNSDSKNDNVNVVFEDNDEDDDYKFKKDCPLVKYTLFTTKYSSYSGYPSKNLQLITKICYLQQISLHQYYCVFRI